MFFLALHLFTSSLFENPLGMPSMGSRNAIKAFRDSTNSVEVLDSSNFVNRASHASLSFFNLAFSSLVLATSFLNSSVGSFRYSQGFIAAALATCLPLRNANSTLPIREVAFFSAIVRLLA